MRRESLIPFVPAVLAALTNAVIVCVITAHQPDYPARAVVYQVVMFGAALLSAVPKKWVRICGLRAIDCRRAHFNGGGASLSSDVLCFRVGDDDR